MRFAEPVPRAVAVDEVVVHAESEVEDLLRAGDVAEQAPVGPAEPEVGGCHQPRSEVLAAVRGLRLVEEPSHRGSGVGAPGAGTIPMCRGDGRGNGTERLDVVPQQRRRVARHGKQALGGRGCGHRR
ncbi:hypothetical protein [Agromyces ramosus]|uniref:Uncharacterized protein n=1 Tax=Agromyces ramosus TaxID=33879 RepID=A0ABU0R825_9MICO|nr:hypothetical protein [Agromyces ramosus]MDQ0894229.1 hypothetical protein [Agromyces ramosus]